MMVRMKKDQNVASKKKKQEKKKKKCNKATQGHQSAGCNAKSYFEGDRKSVEESSKSLTGSQSSEGSSAVGRGPGEQESMWKDGSVPLLISQI